MVNLLKRQLNRQKMVCKNCFFIYTPEYGDEESNIQPFTDFAAIDSLWRCPICEGTKEDFEIYTDKK